MSEFKTTTRARARAREIAARLIPHTTSVHNVDVIAEALRVERAMALAEASSTKETI